MGGRPLTALIVALCSATALLLLLHYKQPQTQVIRQTELSPQLISVFGGGRRWQHQMPPSETADSEEATASEDGAHKEPTPAEDVGKAAVPEETAAGLTVGSSTPEVSSSSKVAAPPEDAGKAAVPEETAASLPVDRGGESTRGVSSSSRAVERQPVERPHAVLPAAPAMPGLLFAGSVRWEPMARPDDLDVFNRRLQAKLRKPSDGLRRTTTAIAVRATALLSGTNGSGGCPSGWLGVL